MQDVERAQWWLVVEQCAHMKSYLRVLNLRITLDLV